MILLVRMRGVLYTTSCLMEESGESDPLGNVWWYQLGQRWLTRNWMLLSIQLSLVGGFSPYPSEK